MIGRPVTIADLDAALIDVLSVAGFEVDEEKLAAIRKARRRAQSGCVEYRTSPGEPARG